MPPAPDTIFALSSGRPPAAIAVVRLSGPRAGLALEALIGRVPKPREARLAKVRDPGNGEVIDEALALWFPGPHSETGEDTAELQLHGGRAVIAAVLGALGRIEGLRPAEAGEFTRRAFENGKLDLTAVEGLADLIGAQTQAQRRAAYRQLKGLLGERAETWRKRLIEALALVEAGIDFSDEADVPEHLVGPALELARGLRDEIAQALKGAARGERLRDGLVVAIAGPPNAGKSTLLNRIAKREAAIVSPFPGTTRDVIEVHLDLDGYPITLLDTAGIRDSDDPVEQEGVRRARERAADADLVLWVVDAADPHTVAGSGAGTVAGIGAASRGGPASRIGDGSRGALASGVGTAARAGRNDAAEGSPVWMVRNKADLVDFGRNNNDKIESRISIIDFNISALHNQGVNLVVESLSRHAAAYFGSEPALVSRERHRKALEIAQSALDRALAEGAAGREDIIAEELRLAARTLGRLTGRVDVEDILDVIFRDFCIGK